MAMLAIPLVASLGAGAAASAAGIAASATFMGMTAAGWGWALGSIAASYLLAPDQEGPRLGDLSTGGSSYGTAIPLVYGTTKLGGNVIWASDLIESQNSESAKGGPELTTYSYSQNIAVLVCAGPVTGIRRIWANGRLILDASDTNTGSTGQNSNIRIYSGSETQVADSLLEAALGVGNVPAHRGYCYVVFDNLQLEDFGNRTPNFEFEVVSLGEFTHPTPEVLFSGIADTNYFHDQAMIHYRANGSRDLINVYDIYSREWVSSYTLEQDAYALWPGPQNTAFGWDTGLIFQYDRQTGETIESWSTTGSSVGAYRPINDTFVFTLSGKLYELAHGQPVTLIASFTGTPLWQEVRIAGDLVVLYSEYSNKIAVVNLDNEIILLHTTTVGGGSAGVKTVTTYDQARNTVYICSSDGETIHVVDLDSMTVTANTFPGESFAWPTYFPVMDVIAISSGGSKPTLWLVDPDSMTILDSWGADPYWPESYLGAKIYIDTYNPEQGVLIGTTSSFLMAATLVQLNQRLSSGQVTLSSIVEDLCGRAGLEATDYDVSELTDLVDGYKTT